MSIKAKAMSIREKINNISKEQKVPYQNIEKSFLIERLLSRITSNANLFKKLIFKGGYVGLRVYDSKRYTVDLDAIVKNANLESTLSQIQDIVETEESDAVWFALEKTVDLQTQGEYGGTRQVYRAGIGEKLKNISKASVVHFDVGAGDPVIPISVKTKSLLSNELISWQVYPIETIIAEKIHAFIARDGESSRAKDIYDLSFYLPKANKEKLIKSLNECFQFRETKKPESFAKKMSSFSFSLTKSGWPKAVSSLGHNVSFDKSLEVVLSSLKKINI